jgi:uncharacterized protein (TIGR03435 family)
VDRTVWPLRIDSNLFRVLPAVVGIALCAQSPDATDWQTAAGGKMEFEVASVRPSKVLKFPKFPLDERNAYVPGNRFSAGLGLASYIGFAYKLDPSQMTALSKQVPKAVNTSLYWIEARAGGNPTKDQIRLMMQSLLADRFKLAVHFETRESPVFDLTLVRPGKTGPKLRPHAEGPPCPDSYALSAPGPRPNSSNVFPENCETAAMQERNGIRMVGTRNTTMALLANAIYSYGGMAGEVDKPVVDKTGLSWNVRFHDRVCAG